MPTPYRLAFVACVAAVVVVIGEQILRKRREKMRNPEGLPYPPGPRQLPFVGSMCDLSLRLASVCAISLRIILTSNNVLRCI